MSEQAGILILDRKARRDELVAMLESYFESMIKYVVDVRREVVAIGGELHCDAEQMLMESGSSQSDLWGANYHPGVGAEKCIAYTALINIRPTAGNRSMEVCDPEIREAMRRITFRLIGEGEAI
ncbi:MAG: DUF5674 family protein [Planctomycetota bacterium]|nr:DUF5674 family protein [Planctomycetota bacterium]MDA1141763.1 DUF5674 family protein [Planctomycetota bacterium]